MYSISGCTFRREKLDKCGRIPGNDDLNSILPANKKVIFTAFKMICQYARCSKGGVSDLIHAISH
jgi:hypothetical protein